MITRQQKQHSLQSSQAGFSIIESLIAVLVVTILLVGVAPVITLSVAARVQARRVERATEAAKAYIDGVRSGAIPAPEPNTPPLTAPLALASIAAPASGSLNCPQGGTYCTTPPNTLYCVNLDKVADCSINSANDIIVQGVRTGTATDTAQGYTLGIRVYRANAFSGSGQLLSSNASNGRQTQSALSGTLGNAKAPVVEMTADVPPIQKQNTLKGWCDRTKEDPSNPNPDSNCN